MAADDVAKISEWSVTLQMFGRPLGVCQRKLQWSSENAFGTSEPAGVVVIVSMNR
jgi:hypothetical protein